MSAYRIAQEALTNVLRHAGATEVRIALRREEGRLTAVVGNGPPAPAHTPVPGSGLGLVGMRERVALFDGALRAGPLGGGWQVETVFRFPEPAVPASRADPVPRDDTAAASEAGPVSRDGAAAVSEAGPVPRDGVIAGGAG
ncbi:ATP-binding protein [Planomonospora algeriensis]